MSTGKKVKGYGTKSKDRLWSRLLRSDRFDRIIRDFSYSEKVETIKRLEDVLSGKS